MYTVNNNLYNVFLCIHLYLDVAEELLNAVNTTTDGDFSHSIPDIPPMLIQPNAPTIQMPQIPIFNMNPTHIPSLESTHPLYIIH